MFPFYKLISLMLSFLVLNGYSFKKKASKLTNSCKIPYRNVNSSKIRLEHLKYNFKLYRSHNQQKKYKEYLRYATK